ISIVFGSNADSWLASRRSAIVADFFVEHFGMAQPLRFLEPSIRAMGEILDRYTDFFHDLYTGSETAYVCGERAALSQLAGGIWRSDKTNFVLEEYACEKRCETGGYTGRADIWFLANSV